MPRRPAALALLAALAACGGGSDDALCTTVKAAIDGLNTKGGPCGVAIPNPINAQTCASHLPNCTAADRSALQGFANCVQGLPTCSTATAASWAAQAQTCTNGLATVSAACGN